MRRARRKLGFVLAASAHGPLIVDRFDYNRDGDRLFGVGGEILEWSFFDPEEIDLLLGAVRCRRQYFGDGAVLIDCGANIGVHTVAEILPAQPQQIQYEVDFFGAEGRAFEDLAADPEEAVALAVVIEAVDDQRTVARRRQHKAEFPPGASHGVPSTHYRWTVSRDSMLHERHPEGDPDYLDGG